MKAIISVIGTDKIGIIANVTNVLSNQSINILDISQTILQDYFTMIMAVDLTHMTCQFNELSNLLDKTGADMNLSIKVQHQAIFDAMHDIEYGSDYHE